MLERAERWGNASIAELRENPGKKAGLPESSPGVDSEGGIEPRSAPDC